MLDALRDFLRQIAPADGDRREDDDPLVAAAALLNHVSEVDGTQSAAERARLRAILAEHYGLGQAESGRIAEAGREADHGAVDLFRFTSVLTRHLSESERARFVELLWEVVYVDRTVHELEDNIVWRIAELLGVSARERMLGKREAAARSAGDSGVDG